MTAVSDDPEGATVLLEVAELYHRLPEAAYFYPVAIPCTALCIRVGYCLYTPHGIVEPGVLSDPLLEEPA